MTSSSYAHFDHVIDNNIYEWNSASEGGFRSSTGENEYMLPTARNVGVKEGTKTILQAIRTVKIVSVFDKFAESMVSSIQSIFPASTSAAEGVREKLLSVFHTKQISELEGIWQDFFVKLGLQKPLYYSVWADQMRCLWFIF